MDFTFILELNLKVGKLILLFILNVKLVIVLGLKQLLEWFEY